MTNKPNDYTGILDKIVAHYEKPEDLMTGAGTGFQAA